jgi:hypothetical protein
MPGELHRHRVRYTGANQVPNRRPPEVVHQLARHSCRLTGTPPCGAQGEDRLAVAVKDERAEHACAREALVMLPERSGCIGSAETPRSEERRGPVNWQPLRLVEAAEPLGRGLARAAGLVALGDLAEHCLVGEPLDRGYAHFDVVVALGDLR